MPTPLIAPLLGPSHVRSCAPHGRGRLRATIVAGLRGELAGRTFAVAIARAMAPANPSSSLAVLVFALAVSACDDGGKNDGGAGGGAGGAAGLGGATGAGASTSEGGTAGVGGAASQGGSAAVGGSSSTGSGGGGGAEIEDPGSMTSDARIYTTDGTEYVIDEIGDAFAHAATSASDNLVFYVHGRGCGGGGEPEKSLSEAMPALESDYGSRAILFNWQGSDVGCPLGFPEDQARAAGPAFAHALHKLAFYKATHRARSPA